MIMPGRAEIQMECSPDSPRHATAGAGDSGIVFDRTTDSQKIQESGEYNNDQEQQETMQKLLSGVMIRKGRAYAIWVICQLRKLC